MVRNERSRAGDRRTESKDLLGGRYFVTRQPGETRGTENGGKPPMHANTANKLSDNDAEELFLAGTDEEL